jgi:hypothetical protein
MGAFVLRFIARAIAYLWFWLIRGRKAIATLWTTPISARRLIILAGTVGVLGVFGECLKAGASHALDCLKRRCEAPAKEIPAEIPGMRPAAPPPYPNAQTVPHWYFNPSNSLGCASNSNDCVHSTCVGGTEGPCLDYEEITSRWTTNAPWLAQNTVITQIGSESRMNHWIVFNPYVVDSSDVRFECDSRGTATGSGTITVTQGWDPTHNSDLQVTFSGVSPANIGSLVVDTSRSSQAWAMLNPSGGTWQISTPLLSGSPPLHNNCGFLAEDTGWTTGDNVTVYPSAGCDATIAQIHPTFVGQTDAGAVGTAVPPNAVNQLTVWRVNFADPSGHQSTTDLGSHVQVLECSVEGKASATTNSLFDMTTDTTPPRSGIVNTLLGGFSSELNITGSQHGDVQGATTMEPVCLYGGGIAGVSPDTRLTVNGPAEGYPLYVAADFEVSAKSGSTTGNLWLNASSMVESAAVTGVGQISFNATSMIFQPNTSDYSEGPYVWGSKSIQIAGAMRLIYRDLSGLHGPCAIIAGGGDAGCDAGGSGAIAVNQNNTTGTIITGTCRSVCPFNNFGTATITSGIPLTAINLAATCSDAGFGGYAECNGTEAVIDRSVLTGAQ